MIQIDELFSTTARFSVPIHCLTQCHHLVSSHLVTGLSSLELNYVLIQIDEVACFDVSKNIVASIPPVMFLDMIPEELLVVQIPCVQQLQFTPSESCVQLSDHSIVLKGLSVIW